MANHPSALKRIRQNERRRIRNRSYRSAAKTQIKKVLQAVEAKKADEAAEALRQATAILHKSASKGVFSRKTAARKTARLARRVNALNS